MDLSQPITDLATLLSTLTVSQRPGEFCMATVPATTPLGDGVEALMVEDEGVTAISTTARAEAEVGTMSSHAPGSRSTSTARSKRSG